MATEIVMPRLSDSMEEGTILRWIKSEGDEVAVGDELVEIETDKANMVYEADAGGTLIEIVAAEGDTLPIGEVIARVGEAGEATGDGGAKKKTKSEREAPGEDESPAAEPEGDGKPAEAEDAGRAAPATAERPAAPEEPAAAEGDGRVKASPIARRLARDRGLDLAAISGSGPGGRIVKADVEQAVSAGPAAAAAPTAAPAKAAAPTAGVRERPETAKGEVETVELTKL